MMSKCPYEESETTKEHLCPVPDTHAYWIGSRADCRLCRTYREWLDNHKEELEALRKER